MRFQFFSIIVLASITLLPGCHRPTENSDTGIQDKSVEPIAIENQTQPESIDNRQAQNTEPEKSIESRDSDKPFQADFSSKAFPEIHTTLTRTEMPWGIKERTTLQWHDDIEIYYEIPEFKGDLPVFEKINTLLKEKKDAFFTENSLKEVWGYESARHEDSIELKEKYQNLHKLDNVQITDKYITFTIGYEWYMGGVNDYGLITFNYDLNGKPLTLTDIYQKSDADIHQMVVKAVKDYIETEGNEIEGLIEWDLLENKREFSFYIRDGIPQVVFNKYEISVGAAGSFILPLPKP